MNLSYVALKPTALYSVKYRINSEKNGVIFRTREIFLLAQSSAAKNNNWVISFEALKGK